MAINYSYFLESVVAQMSAELIAALAALAAGTAILGPLGEAAAGTVTALMVQREVKKAVFKAAASNFGLQDDGPLLDTLYTVYETADAIHTTFFDEISGEINEAFKRIKTIVDGGDALEDLAARNGVGYRYVTRVTDDRPFVVFSDHHIAFDGHRQNFFGDAGNRQLYIDVLSQYGDSGFTLIENGDIEELVVLEPTPNDVAMRAGQAALGDVSQPLGTSWDPADAYRRAKRLEQLEKVIRDNRELYEHINERFHQHGRYLKTVGNHDQDTQLPEYLEKLRGVFPGLPTPYDFVIIESSKPDGTKQPKFVICHGHHFDSACTPLYAPRVGETISEALSWAFQGADRVWTWGGDDDVRAWTEGRERFLNNVVSGATSPVLFSTYGTAALQAAIVAAAATGGLLPASLAAGGMLAVGLQPFGDEGLWEAAFKHNIAWEYFESSDPGEAVFNEMFRGTEWFKFRHLDEQFIIERWSATFSDSVAPYLLLGHSHEPRHNARAPDGRQYVPYVNSGAAGRFENLLWAVEIIHGAPQIVAWYRPGGPTSGETPVRLVYTPEVSGSNGYLVPSEPTPLPKDNSWLVPTLHMMMG